MFNKRSFPQPRGDKRESRAFVRALNHALIVSARGLSYSNSHWHSHALPILAAACAAAFSHLASAQAPVFSLTWQGPPKGTPSFFGFPITEGDLLIPPPPAFAPMPGPLPPPVVAVSAGFGPPGPGLALPLGPGAVGVPPGIPGGVELDAVSFGVDFPITPGMPAADLIWSFSVDEFSAGIPGSLIPPNVFTMGAAGFMEAAPSIFIDVASGAGPTCVPAPGGGNTLLIDCNGMAPPGGYPGLFGPPPFGMNPPAAGVPDMGADIDALDLDAPPGPGFMAGVPGVGFPIYYSLESGIFSAAEGVPGSGSAAANGGFLGGDVLVCIAPGAPPMLYAPAFMLGIPGPMNDLDALVLWENGVPGYQPPTIPYSWVPGVVAVPTDMLFYSVRPGSAVIGVIDGLCGAPITAGDILWGPAAPGFPPRKWIAAAQLGLTPMDNIDALDLVADCNANGFPDRLDILIGGSADINANLIPDECECLPDITGDGFVNIDDLLAVITGWGGAGGAADVDFDGDVDIDDLLIVIGAWGPCP